MLKNESTRYVNATGFFLCVGSAALFLREMVIRQTAVPAYLAGVLFVVGWIVYNSYMHRHRGHRVYFSKALLIAGLVWTRMPYFQWLLFVFAALAILEYQAKKPPEIGFSADRIVFSGLFRKTRSWSEIQYIVLKDGLLTIGFNNNRLFQKELESGDDEASEQEFNEWCAKQLGRGPFS